jgi:hypothetical protein
MMLLMMARLAGTPETLAGFFETSFLDYHVHPNLEELQMQVTSTSSNL